jgi:L-cystine uptake protein TcyP (sodium:dicarboxylate symporter family)
MQLVSLKLFILTLIAVVVISSFGVAGVGGGATFASILVLSTSLMQLVSLKLIIQELKRKLHRHQRQLHQMN